MTTRRTVLVSTVILSLGHVPMTLGAFDLFWRTIDGGGGHSAGGDFELEGTIGQHDAGVLTGGEFQLAGGFWGGAASAVPFPGDCDGNGVVDLADFVVFDACLSGPGGGLGTGCECFDFDSDGDNDLLDFAEFQLSFTGP